MLNANFPQFKLSWHSCSVWEKLGWLNFCERGSLYLIQEGSVTHMHCLAVYERKMPFCMGYISRKLCRFHSMSYLFFLYQSPSSPLCVVFDPILSNTDEVLSINPSANVFVSGDFNNHHKDWLTYSGSTDGPANFFIIFLSQMTWLRWLTVLPGSLTHSHGPALLDLFSSSDTTICSTMAFHPLGNFDLVVVCFHWLSVKLKMGRPVLSHSLWPFSCWSGWCLWSFERCSMGRHL